MPKITVLLADDHTVVRQGLRSLLAAETDIEVVGEAETGRQALQLARKLQPHVIVMDLAMPQLNGLEATRQITQEVPASRVIILSSYSDDEYVQQLTDAGAIGYLLKQTASNDLIKAIREARQGNAYFSPAISRRMLEHYRRAFVNGQPVRKTTDTLTSPRNARCCRTDRFRGQHQQADRQRTEHQHQDGGEAPPAGDEPPQHSRHRRPYPLRHRERHDRDEAADGCGTGDVRDGLSPLRARES